MFRGKGMSSLKASLTNERGGEKTPREAFVTVKTRQPLRRVFPLTQKEGKKRKGGILRGKQSIEGSRTSDAHR